MAKNESATSSKQALQTSAQERDARNKALDTSGNMISGASQALQGFYGPGMDEWKRTQVNQRTSDTTGAFNNDAAAQRLRARQAGFGYEQPGVQQDQSNIENARAGAISKIPGQVEAEAVPIELQAAGQEGQLANAQQGIARTYDPEGYYNSAVSQDQAAAQRRASMWNSIIGAGTGIARAF
jgi:hypothetical protein